MKASVQLMASSAVTLLLVTGMSVLTAYGLGPEEFGLYAAAQAVAVVLMPLVSLRLETRIAVCTTDEALTELVTAVTTVAAAFLMVAGLLALLAGVWTASLSYALVALLSAGMVIADLGLARLAFAGEHGTLAVLRRLRQVLPVAMALAVRGPRIGAPACSTVGSGDLGLGLGFGLATQGPSSVVVGFASTCVA